jgi:anti-sigma factor RsiW
MKPFEEQFSAWVDGQLNDAEFKDFEKQLAAHPEAAADKEAALKLGRLLREHPTAPPLGNPDFFNHQLMQRIAAETPRPVERREKKRAFFFSIPSFAWAGVFCLLVSFALFKTTIPSGQAPVSKSDYFAQVVEAWPTSPNVSASTVYSPEDNVTVLWLDGLDYIPANYALK